MKTKTLFITFLTSFALSHAGASSVDDQKLAAANNNFSFKLLKQIAASDPETNIFISPYSASTALQMVANGAAGQTKTEMQSVLGTSTAATGLSEDAINQAQKTFHNPFMTEIPMSSSKLPMAFGATKARR